MLGNRSFFAFFLALFLLEVRSSVHIVNIDLLEHHQRTTASYYTNFLGFVMDYEEVEPFINTTLFQSYSLNTNLNFGWSHNLFSHVRFPHSWGFNCEITAPQIREEIVTTD